jgi:hypothetical protein
MRHILFIIENRALKVPRKARNHSLMDVRSNARLSGQQPSERTGLTGFRFHWGAYSDGVSEDGTGEIAGQLAKKQYFIRYPDGY